MQFLAFVLGFTELQPASLRSVMSEVSLLIVSHPLSSKDQGRQRRETLGTRLIQHGRFASSKHCFEDSKENIYSWIVEKLYLFSQKG